LSDAAADKFLGLDWYQYSKQYRGLEKGGRYAQKISINKNAAKYFSWSNRNFFSLDQLYCAGA